MLWPAVRTSPTVVGGKHTFQSSAVAPCARGFGHPACLKIRTLWKKREDHAISIRIVGSLFPKLRFPVWLQIKGILPHLVQPNEVLLQQEGLAQLLFQLRQMFWSRLHRRRSPFREVFWK